VSLASLPPLDLSSNGVMPFFSVPLDRSLRYRPFACTVYVDRLREPFMRVDCEPCQRWDTGTENEARRVAVKHGHSAEDIAGLAVRLRASRNDGAPVSAWLDQHHEMLQSLVPLGWTWDQLADAMNAAGIRYEAGKPRPIGKVSRGRWTGEQLRNAVRHTRTRIAERHVAMQKVLATPHMRTLPPVMSPSPQQAIQRLAEGSKPVVRVFGALAAEPAQSEAEPGSVQRMVDEKNARTQSIIDSFLNERKNNGSQG